MAADLETSASLRIVVEACLFAVGVLVVHLLRRCVPRGDGSVWPRVLLIIQLTLCWYCVSITLTLGNKWMFSVWHGGMRVVMFATTFHMASKGIIAVAVLSAEGNGLWRNPHFRSRRSWTAGLCIGVFTGLDVAASNMSLRFVPVSLYTLLKSASIVFLSITGTLMGLESCSRNTAAGVVLMAGGICLAVTTGPEDDGKNRVGLGVALVLFSEMCAALRWSLTQRILKQSLQDLPARERILTTVSLMAPASFLSTLPLVFVNDELSELQRISEDGLLVPLLILIVFAAFFAFALILVEVVLVMLTAALTLAVLGHIKTICTIIIAVIIFKEPTGLGNWIGIGLAMSGAYVYSLGRTVETSGHVELQEAGEPDGDLDGGQTPHIIGQPMNPFGDDVEPQTGHVGTRVGRKGSEFLGLRSCDIADGETGNFVNGVAEEEIHV